jgi:uncharacterized YigZ family protein
MKRYPIPAHEAHAETTVVNSRFIANLAPTFSVEAARAFIARIRNQYPDASHHVPAFLIGYGASTIEHCTDDGEPSGTAGRPALAVLKGSGLGDVTVVVTRYFGGTKLGTGGLVRAYGDAVKAVLGVTPLAEKVPTHLARLVLPYPLYERTRLLVEQHHGQIQNEEFGAEVTLILRFTVDSFPEFQHDLKELSRGDLQAEVTETNQETIMPIGLFP